MIKKVIQLVMAVQVVFTMQACSRNTIHVTEVEKPESVINTSDLYQVTVKNMSKVHSTQSYQTFNKSNSPQDFKSVISAVEQSEWVKSNIEVDDVTNLKGKYIGLLQYDNGETKYTVCMNETRMEDVDSRPFESMLEGEIQQDSQIVAYIIDMQNRMVYETASQNIQNILLNLGDKSQINRATNQFRFQTSRDYDEYAYFEYYVGNPSLDERDVASEELMVYLQEYFDASKPNLSDKLNAYEDIKDSEYKAKLIVNDQLEYAMYAMYLMNDDTVRIFDYTNGNSWIDSTEETLNNMLNCLDIFKIA